MEPTLTHTVLTQTKLIHIIKKYKQEENKKKTLFGKKNVIFIFQTFE